MTAYEQVAGWIARMEPYIQTPELGSPIGQEEKFRMVRMQENGKTIQEIADWTGRTPGTVRRSLTSSTVLKKEWDFGEEALHA